jgi:hypothetical protein
MRKYKRYPFNFLNDFTAEDMVELSHLEVLLAGMKGFDFTLAFDTFNLINYSSSYFVLAVMEEMEILNKKVI